MSVINTNITSLIAQKNLTASENKLSTSIERLSSGMKINSAADDAAGQAIANRMTAQITGLTQAGKNASDGISLAQTTEGALNQVNDNLQRIRELTVQAANGTNSSSDLTSIQDEITQRLDEINRVSSQTAFNGVNVLAKDQTISLQVGANDGETISIDLKAVTAQSLGLNGFNVNGSGVTQNAGATVTNVLAAGGVASTTGGDYTVTTDHEAATFDQIAAQMTDGNTVAVTDAATTTTYTYDAAAGNFSFDKEVATGTAADLTALADTLVPTSGTKTGTYEYAGGDVASFEVDATGKITIGGQAAYLSATNELTTNDAGGTAATMETVLAAAAGVATGNVTIGDNSYKGDGAGTLTYKATASQTEVSLAMTTAGVTGTAVTLGSGITSATVSFGAASTDSTDTYVDADGELTTTASFDTNYSIDADTGAVTVATGSTGTGKYEAEVGATANVSSKGELTTATTSAGDKTTDPLAAIDAALSAIDNQRSGLGAIQNRLDSAISNITTITTNLTSARSGIQDVDYATEVSSMTSAQILQQAGTSVLAQANSMPQQMLSLLG